MSKGKNKITTNWKVLIRVVILLIIFSFGYYNVVSTIRSGTGLSLSDLLGGAGVILLGSMATVGSLALLSIDLQKLEKGVIDLFNVVLLLLIVTVIYFTYKFTSALFLQLIAIIFFHIGIFVYLRTKKNYLETRLDTSMWGISEIGIVTFGIFIGIIITLFLGVKIVDAPLECNTLYDNLQKATYSSIEPLKDASQSILNWSKQSVGDVAKKVGAANKSAASEGSLFTVVKTTLVDQVLEDKNLVRGSFCDMIAQLLKNRVNNNVRSLSVYLILFLILSPLMTLLFRIVSVIVWILFKILKFSNVYTWRKRMREVRELI